MNEEPEEQSSGNEVVKAEHLANQQQAPPESVQTLIVKAPKGGLAPLALSEALTDIREIRNEAAMILLRNYAGKLESELETIRKERNEAQQKAENWMKDYYEQKESSAVLTSALHALSGKKNLQKFMAAVGALAAGAGIPFLVIGPVGWGIAGCTLGVPLMAVGFWPSKVEGISK